MRKQSATNGVDRSSRDDSANGEAELRIKTLEDRVRQLENEVIRLKDTRQIEDRLVESVTARVARERSSQEIKEAGNPLVEAGRKILPVATLALQQGVHAAEAQARAVSPTTAPPWLLFDLYAEARATIRMYLDPRYRVGWSGWVLPIMILAAIGTSWIWIPGTSILYSLFSPLSTLLVKGVDLLLAFGLYKVLHREVQRYRQVSPDLPPSLRL